MNKFLESMLRLLRWSISFLHTKFSSKFQFIHLRRTVMSMHVHHLQNQSPSMTTDKVLSLSSMPCGVLQGSNKFSPRLSLHLCCSSFAVCLSPLIQQNFHQSPVQLYLFFWYHTAYQCFILWKGSWCHVRQIFKNNLLCYKEFIFLHIQTLRHL